MKKPVISIVSLVMVLLFSQLVSAGLFADMFRGAITGMITSDVQCPDDVRVCNDGSYVAMIPPYCNFAPCPVLVACTDTDGGRNYNVKGTITTSDGVSQVDYCISQSSEDQSVNLMEYYCFEDGTRASYGYYCRHGCTDGACNECSVDSDCATAAREDSQDTRYVCSRGKCISLTPVTPVCSKAGEPGPNPSLGPNDPNIGITCCAGLDMISPGSVAADGSCIILVGAGTICSDCGNGICEAWENKCNCNEDCTDVPICVDKCGDGICAENVCTGTGCPCAESPTTCPEDCAQVTCTDTDGGRDYYVKGMITDSDGISQVDYCISLSTGNPIVNLMEFYCSEEGIRAVSEEYLCPHGCTDGACNECSVDSDCATASSGDSQGTRYICSRGKCIPYIPACVDKCGDGNCDDIVCTGTGCACAENPTNCPADCAEETCTDTDGGINYYVKGVATSSNLKSEDYCAIPISPNLLYEYYCLGHELKAIEYTCEYGCTDGACRIGPILTCEGCIQGTRCIPYGTRFAGTEVIASPVYCGISSSFEMQKADGIDCQNSYECISNDCSSGKCINLQKEAEKTQGLLDQVLDWLRKLFRR